MEPVFKPLTWQDQAARHDPDSLPFWRFYQEAHLPPSSRPRWRNAVRWFLDGRQVAGAQR